MSPIRRNCSVQTQPQSSTVACTLVKAAFEKIYQVAVWRQSVRAVKLLFLDLNLIPLLTNVELAPLTLNEPEP